jgi:hypothetical protein
MQMSLRCFGVGTLPLQGSLSLCSTGAGPQGLMAGSVNAKTD